MANIIRDGIILIVYEFIIILLYIVLSNPVALTLDAIVSAATASGISITSYYNEIKTVFSICFAMLGLIPLVWFVFRMWAREPDWGYRYE